MNNEFNLPNNLSFSYSNDNKVSLNEVVDKIKNNMESLERLKLFISQVVRNKEKMQIDIKYVDNQLNELKSYFDTFNTLMLEQ